MMLPAQNGLNFTANLQHMQGNTTVYKHCVGGFWKNASTRDL